MIEISNLNFRYNKNSFPWTRKPPEVFTELSLSGAPGSIVGLLGKNGSGKSTLLKLIAGLLKAPDKTVSVLNNTPIDRKPSFLEEVFFIPEEIIVFPYTIKRFINTNAIFYPRFDHARLDDILRNFELDKNSNLSTLSFGQRKKFLIAFALSTNCRLLLFDEPTNGLDIPSKTTFRKVLAGSLGEDQLMIISSHQVKDIENLIDQIIIIDKGNVILKKKLWEIEKEYAFTIVNNPQIYPHIYSEPFPGGYKIIHQSDGKSTEIDLELLFNAIMNGVKMN